MLFHLNNINFIHNFFCKCAVYTAHNWKFVLVPGNVIFCTFYWRRTANNTTQPHQLCLTIMHTFISKSTHLVCLLTFTIIHHDDVRHYRSTIFYIFLPIPKMLAFFTLGLLFCRCWLQADIVFFRSLVESQIVATCRIISFHDLASVVLTTLHLALVFSIRVHIMVMTCPPFCTSDISGTS